MIIMIMIIYRERENTHREMNLAKITSNKFSFIYKIMKKNKFQIGEKLKKNQPQGHIGTIKSHLIKRKKVSKMDYQCCN